MFPRAVQPSRTRSFFMFGARGTGKSTYLKASFPEAFVIDLLEDRWESRYLKAPDRLADDLVALPTRPPWVLIDEVQKVPKLLDVVHRLVEKQRNWRFLLTGSSARKLKRGKGNLLAGRAFVYHLYPLTHSELGDAFRLDEVLRWGSLPEVFALNDADRVEYLRAYANTYLREEIFQEQLVRNIGAFRQFVEVAAHENGNALNFQRIARDVGVDAKTARSFFQILEDTLVGVLLPAFHRSVRKSVGQRPKFYWFDLGVKRAMGRQLEDGLTPRTSGYGRAFEHFVICEAARFNEYCRCDFGLFHYQTTAGGEIDLVLQRGRNTIAVEIKSADTIDTVEVAGLERAARDIGASSTYYVSQDPISSRIGKVDCVPWREFFRRVFVAAVRV